MEIPFDNLKDKIIKSIKNNSIIVIKHNHLLYQIVVKINKFNLPNELIDLIIKHNCEYIYVKIAQYYHNYTIISRLNKSNYLNLHDKNIRHKYLNYNLIRQEIHDSINNKTFITYTINHVIYTCDYDAFGMIKNIKKVKKDIAICHRDPKNGPAKIIF